MIYDAHTHGLNEVDPLSLKHIVSETPDDWNQIVSLVSQHNCISGSIGIHPWEVGEKSEKQLVQLETLLRENDSVQIGEIGLDYSRNVDKYIQLDIFSKQLQLSNDLNRIVTIHSVQAWGDMLRIINDVSLPERGVVFHGFRGSAEVVTELLNYNSYFSFGESQLTKCGKKQMKAIEAVSFSRFLIESDGTWSLETAAELGAECKMVSLDTLIEKTNQNYIKLFQQS